MRVWTRFAAGMALALATAWGGAAADVESLVAGVSDPSADVRAEAWKQAGPLGAAAVGPLAEPLASDNPEVALSAARALDNIVDHAGRPGAESEQAAVAAELAKLLDSSRPEFVRRTAVRLLALGGTDAEVPAVAALLSEPTLAEDACLTLEEMPGDAATQALAGALATAVPEVQPRIAAALGKRHGAGVADALREQARSGEGEVKWASLAALARHGVSPLEAFPPTDLSEPDLARYADAFLTAADVRAERGDGDAAARMYEVLARHATRAHHAIAALQGLSKLGSPNLAAAAVEQLGNPDARAEVTALLADAEGPGLDEALVAAYPQAKPTARAALLEVLDRRGSPALEGLLKEARRDASAEVRLAALERLGEPVPEEVLTEVLASASPSGRARAADAILALAQEQEASDPAGAAARYEAIVRADVTAGPKIEAFRGLERLARPESLPLLEEVVGSAYAAGGAGAPELGGDTALDEAAVRAYVKVQAGRGKEAAVPVLVSVLENADSLEVSALAVEALAGFGIDPQALARQKGFITNWKILGPFPNEDGAAARTAFIDEAAGVLPESAEAAGTALRPQDVATEGLPAIVDFRRHYRDPYNKAAYGYAEIESSEERPVLLLVGSDDGCEVWLNGEKVHSALDARSLTVDGDRVEAVLQPGTNRLLIKVLQGGGDWRYCVRIADRDGRPQDLAGLK